MMIKSIIGWLNGAKVLAALIEGIEMRGDDAIFLQLAFFFSFCAHLVSF